MPLDGRPYPLPHRLSGLLHLQSNHDNFYACANGINSGKYAYNNLQDYDATWYHKFNAKWHMATEAWYMYERDVPNVSSNVVNGTDPTTEIQYANTGATLARDHLFNRPGQGAVNSTSRCLLIRWSPCSSRFAAPRPMSPS